MSDHQSDRLAHIASIVDAIAEGTYEVDDLDVADSVLERWRRFDVLTPAEPFEAAGTDQLADVDAVSDDSSL